MRVLRNKPSSNTPPNAAQPNTNTGQREQLLTAINHIPPGLINKHSISNNITKGNSHTSTTNQQCYSQSSLNLKDINAQHTNKLNTSCNNNIAPSPALINRKVI